jgi:hypothetical protein
MEEVLAAAASTSSLKPTATEVEANGSDAVPGSSPRIEDGLDQRIARAFDSGNDTRAADVARLITASEQALQTAAERAAHARSRALDPTITASALAAARADMDDAAFQHQRLDAALGRLRQRQHELTLSEDDARRRARYERLQAQRDQLAAELASLYPEFAAKMGALLPQLQRNNAEIAVINRSLPRGASPLRCAELVARSLPAFQIGIRSYPSIVDSLVLPQFTPGDSAYPYHWPPR